MRIIAGKYRGRSLIAPAGRDTRPITDRVKFSLFDKLAPWLEGANVADVFCGTGSMGLEALSRGARHCWFADKDPSALERLEQNIQALAVAEQATIWRGDVVRQLPAWLDALGEQAPRLDVVLLDPPYALARAWLDEPAALRRLMDALAAPMAEDAVLVYRTPHDLKPPADFARLELKRSRRYGSMALNYYQRPDATA